MDQFDALDDQQATGGESHLVIPSSPADRKRLRTMMSEATFCKQRIDDERQSIKDIVGRIHEEFQLPKKLVTKLINTLYKQDYSNRVAEEEDFQFLYESVVQSGGSAAEKAAQKDEDAAKIAELKDWLRNRGTDPDSEESEGDEDEAAE